MLVGLESLARYLPEAEADNVDSWKATLYKRLNGVRMFDRPVPLLLVSRLWFPAVTQHLNTCSALAMRVVDDTSSATIRQWKPCMHWTITSECCIRHTGM